MNDGRGELRVAARIANETENAALKRLIQVVLDAEQRAVDLSFICLGIEAHVREGRMLDSYVYNMQTFDHAGGKAEVPHRARLLTVLRMFPQWPVVLQHLDRGLRFDNITALAFVSRSGLVVATTTNENGGLVWNASGTPGEPAFALLPRPTTAHERLTAVRDSRAVLIPLELATGYRATPAHEGQPPGLDDPNIEVRV